MAIDYQVIFGGEDYDPCVAVQALRPQYMRMLAGDGEREIRYRDRKVVLAEIDIAALGTLIAQMESECRAKRGLITRRFAITAIPNRR